MAGRFGRRFPIDSAHWFSRVLLHLCFGCGFMLVKVALDLPIYISVLGRDIMMIPLNPDERMLPDIEYLMPLFKTFVLNKFYIYLVLYGVIVAASQFLE